MSKYVLYCAEGNPFVTDFIESVKRNNESYFVVYEDEYENDEFVITHNELVFDDFDEFLAEISSKRL